MAVTTKKLFPATSNATTTVFSPVGIQLNNQDDLDVYVTLSGGTRVLQLRQSTGSTAQSSHPQVNNTDGLYFPAVTAGTTLYNYTLSTDNNTITFNSALPQGAVVFCERRTRDADSSYTSFASGSTIRATDLNNSSTESNFTAQDGRNKALTIEGVLFRGDQPSTNFVTSDHIVAGTIVTSDIANDSVTADKIPDDTINSEHYVDGSIDTQHIANQNITTAKLASNAVTSDKLSVNAVTTAKIVDDAVTGAKIAHDTITFQNLADGSVLREHIGTNAVNEDKIKNSAIITDKIATTAVTENKIAAGAITHSKLGTGSVLHDKLGTNAVETDNIDNAAVTTAKIANDAVTADKIADAVIVTNSEQAAHSVNDTTFFTTAAAEARYFNASTGETIKDGQAFPDNDTTIATTAAINDRIIDLIDDVGGFTIIASEQAFPNVNPQGVTGQAAVLSIKAATTNLVPSGTTVTVVNGNVADNANITITGVTTTIPSGFGFLVESTTTLHTYAFHRLVPKATEVTTVAGKAVEIGRLGTAAAVEDMSILGTTDVVADMALLGTTDVVSDMNALAVTDVINDMNTLAVTDVISDMDVVATNVTNVNNVGNNVTNVNSVSNSAGANQTFTVTVQNVSGSNKYFIDGVQTPVLKLARGKTYTFNMSDGSNATHPLAFRDSSDNSYTTGVTTYGTAGYPGGEVVIVVAANAPNSLKYYCTSHGNAMGNTITVIDDNVGTVAGSISNVNTVGGAISNVNTTATNISNVNTVASNISNVNSFFNTYRIGANNPTTSLDVGDLFFNTTSNSLKVYTGSAWVDGVTATGNFAVVTGNTFTGSNVHNDNVKSIYGTSSDGLEIFHTGNNSIINDNGTGTLFLQMGGSNKLWLTSAGVNIGGNITVSGNVDGRDVAADGTKLDGIEASATADGGSNGTDYNDDVRIRLGNSQDFEIFHQASNGNSIIRETGGGNLSLQTNGTNINFYDSANAATLASFFTGGAVKLYHDSNLKFETTSYGAEFFGNTGIARTAGGYTFREVAGGNERAGIHSDASNDLIFKAGGANEAARFDASTLRFGIGTTTPAAPLHVVSDANNMMQLVSTDRYSTMYLVDSVGSTFIQCDSGVLRFGGGGGAGAAGGESEFMRIGSTGLVGIGTNSPQSDLHIESATPALRLSDSGNSSAYCLFDGNGANLNIHADKGNTVDNTTIGFGVDNAIQFNIDSIGAYFVDNKKLRFGGSSDLQIYHNGSQSFIDDAGTGALRIRSNQILFEKYTGENLAKFTSDGAVELYYDNSKKFETTTAGVLVQGIQKITNPGATAYLRIGDNATDNQYAHLDLVGDTTYSSYGFRILRANTGANTSSNIYHRGSGWLALNAQDTGGGILLQTENTSRWRIDADGTFRNANDTNKIKLGASNDLEIYHDGSNSFIDNSGTGIFYIRGNGTNSLRIRANPTEDSILCIPNGGAKLYFNNGEIFETLVDGARITGTSGSTKLDILANNDQNVNLNMSCDNADDNGDTWRLQVVAASQRFNIMNNTSGTQAAKFSVDTNGDTHVHAGNLKIGTSGKGIDFSATADGGNGTGRAEVLDDYEEGSWSFGLTGPSGNASYATAARYTKIGRMVHLHWSDNVARSSVGSSGTLTVNATYTSLPFTPISGTRTAYAFPHRNNNWAGNVDERGLMFELYNSTLRLGILGDTTTYNNPISQNASLASGSATAIPMSLSLTYYTND